MQCPKCKKNLPPDAKKCDTCGYEFAGEKRTAANITYDIKKLFSSFWFYLANTVLSVSVLFEMISAITSPDSGSKFFEALGLETLFKPVDNFLGEWRVAVSLAVMIPSALLCIGLWMLPITSVQSYKNGSSSGFRLIKISAGINATVYGAIGAILTMMLGASVIGTSTYTEKYVTLSLAVIMLIFAAATVLFVAFFISVIKISKAFEYSLRTGRYVKINVKFVSIFCIALAVLFVIICIILANASEITSYALRAVYLVFTSYILRTASKDMHAHVSPEKKSAKRSRPISYSIKNAANIRNANAFPKPYIPHEPEQLSFAIPNKNKKYCRKCGEMIAENEMYCPFCHANQDPDSQQHFKI